MANKKISQLQTVSELEGTEILPIVQGGITKKVTAQAIADLGGGGGGSISPINIVADGTVTSNNQSISYTTTAVIGTQSGNQTVTPITFPQIYMGSNATATTITISGLPLGALMLSNAPSLVTVTLSDLERVMFGGMMALTVAGCSSLTTINLPALTTVPAGIWFDFSNNALTQATVDYILNKFAAIAPSTSQYTTLSLQSGTNAAPSAAGLASKAILVDKGWTVNHN